MKRGAPLRIGIFSAILMILGLSPFHLWPCSWLAFLPWFLWIEKNRQATPSEIKFPLVFTGLLYFGFLLYWLWNYDQTVYLSALVSLLPCFLVYFSVFAFLQRILKHPSAKFILAPALWIILMKIYSLTPIGTIAPEIPFYGPFAFFQIASLAGFKLHGALIVGLNASLAALIHKKNRTHMIACSFFITLLITSYLWGKEKLSDPIIEGNLKAALIQHNLSSKSSWNLNNSKTILETYERLALEASHQKPNLIIFPLYTLPGNPLQKPDFFTSLASKIETPILIATYVSEEKGDALYDMALLYTPDGKVADIYQAIQPPPFRKIGEKNITDYKLLETSIGKAGIFLCYENGLERMAQKAVMLGANFFISLSNPGVFNQSFMPHYHLMQDRLRAIESGRTVLRVSPNSYSALIDSRGRIVEQTKLNEEKILSVNFSGSKNKTFFSQNPDWSFWFSLLFLAGVLRNKKYQPA